MENLESKYVSDYSNKNINRYTYIINSIFISFTPPKAITSEVYNTSF